MSKLIIPRYRASGIEKLCETKEEQQEVKKEERSMTITNILHQHGQVLMRRDDIAKHLGMSTVTVDIRCKEIEKEIAQGRYSEKSLTKVGGMKLINYLVFCDYLHYKERLENKNLRKSVPAYDPVSWAHELGIYTVNEKVTVEG